MIFIININIREITPLKPKRGFPVKRFRSGLSMCYCLIQNILLLGFDVYISIVRLNWYVIKSNMKLESSS